MNSLVKIFAIYITLLSTVNFLHPEDTYSQGTYFHDADLVYLRNGNPDNFDSLRANDQRTIYWDLSSIFSRRCWCSKKLPEQFLNLGLLFKATFWSPTTRLSADEALSGYLIIQTST